jgi:hypothetical protein
VRSIHNNVDIVIEPMISIPPIVGVPAFLKWDVGPSSLIGCPTCISFNFLIIHGPIIRQIRSAVSEAYIVLKVMYLKRLKNEIYSESQIDR